MKNIEYFLKKISSVKGLLFGADIILLVGNFATLLLSAVLFFSGYAIVLIVLKEPLMWEIENQVFTKIKGMIK